MSGHYSLSTALYTTGTVHFTDSSYFCYTYVSGLDRYGIRLSFPDSLIMRDTLKIFTFLGVVNKLQLID